jgi:hypothetical protein
MKAKFSFKIGNRGLLEEELGLAARVNASLRASAERHGMDLKPGVFVTVKRVQTGNGKMVRRVSAENKDPVEVPLIAA